MENPEATGHLKRVTRLFADGEGLLNKNPEKGKEKIQEALSLCLSVIEAAPHTVEAYELASQIFLRLGDRQNFLFYQKAHRSLKKEQKLPKPSASLKSKQTTGPTWEPQSSSPITQASDHTTILNSPLEAKEIAVPKLSFKQSSFDVAAPPETAAQEKTRSFRLSSRALSESILIKKHKAKSQPVCPPEIHVHLPMKPPLLSKPLSPLSKAQVLDKRKTTSSPVGKEGIWEKITRVKRLLPCFPNADCQSIFALLVPEQMNLRLKHTEAAPPLLRKSPGAATKNIGTDTMSFPCKWESRTKQLPDLPFSNKQILNPRLRVDDMGRGNYMKRRDDMVNTFFKALQPKEGVLVTSPILTKLRGRCLIGSAASRLFEPTFPAKRIAFAPAPRLCELAFPMKHAALLASASPAHDSPSELQASQVSRRWRAAVQARGHTVPLELPLRKCEIKLAQESIFTFQQKSVLDSVEKGGDPLLTFARELGRDGDRLIVHGKEKEAAEAYIESASALIEAGEVQEAAEMFARASKCAPDNPDIVKLIEMQARLDSRFRGNNIGEITGG